MWNTSCIKCSASKSPVHSVSTLPMRDSIINRCEKRENSWSFEVKNRILGSTDLVAADAVYHEDCHSRFMLNKQLSTSTLKKPQGRPQDKGMLQWFDMLCQWLVTEGDVELYTLSELHEKMTELACDSEVYSIKRLKQKLQEH